MIVETWNSYFGSALNAYFQRWFTRRLVSVDVGGQLQSSDAQIFKSPTWARARWSVFCRPETGRREAPRGRQLMVWWDFLGEENQAKRQCHTNKKEGIWGWFFGNLIYLPNGPANLVLRLKQIINIFFSEMTPKIMGSRKNNRNMFLY